MKQSSKCALGGITAALSLVMMISVAIVPFMTYALPAIAGALTVFMVVEVDKKWAFGVYAAVAILGMFLVPEKEVAVMYLALFGYYPIVKALIESKIPAVVGWLLKIILFEITMVVSYILMIKFMGVTIDEMDTLGKLAIPILLGAGTLAFIIYDFALTRLVSIYTRNWRKHFRRYFK
ncbi:MAG: hypothetical protein IJJ61_02895 [Clostridia bacterium]|nr:hypothetical protein [Clostridia bacterium]